MRAGVILSTSLHVGILGWALLSLSGPPPLVTMQDGGVEVDFASISPDASSANGEKKAEVDAKPVPVPTTRPEKAPDAKNVGDANEDSKSRKGEVTDKPLDTEKTQAAPKAEKVVSAPKVKPEPVVEPVKKETPVETTEVASLNEPKVPVTAEPEPKEDLPPVDPDQASDAPKVVPVPARPPADRPKPKPKTPETTEAQETRRGQAGKDRDLDGEFQRGHRQDRRAAQQAGEYCRRREARRQRRADRGRPDGKAGRGTDARRI